jgi:hypothetical protein
MNSSDDLASKYQRLGQEYQKVCAYYFNVTRLRFCNKYLLMVYNIMVKIQKNLIMEDQIMFPS